MAELAILTQTEPGTVTHSPGGKTMKVDKELVQSWIIVALLTGLAIWMIWNETKPPKGYPEHGPWACYVGHYTDGGNGWQCVYHTREEFCERKPMDCREGR